jgi:hypothetical protein
VCSIVVPMFNPLHILAVADHATSRKFWTNF